MQFTHEHEELQRTLKRFIDEQINPHVDAWEAEEIFPAHQVFKQLGDLGLLGLCKPVEYGGLGLDYSYSVAMAETLGHVHCGAIPMAIGVQTDMSTPALARFGSDALKREFLVPAIAGDMVACIGVSEPGAGSDVAAIKTTARKDGGDYIINGGKMWITNSLQADFMVVLCNTSEGAPHKNKSLIVVPMNTPGVTRAKKIRKIGMMSSDTGLIHFDDVRVPQANRIGEEGMGFTYQMMQFQEERLWAAANAVQGLSNCIAQTIEYTRERKAFGQAVLDNQVVHFRLAELKTEVEALRALTYLATEHYVAGKDVTEWASMAKLKAGRLLREVPDACLQYWGGMGYTWDNLVSRMYRDGRLGSIGGGADEVMLGIIAKYMHTLPARR
ncbi:acyl-CoA dehydrogenase family protein [Roseateles toxinivorans]|uniref:Citronellyl-CoA dehydrogenase n=1 Tax=Roseateles toxinivorans TaxID=270368 RepID=A0A4R6QBE0_9BURK|nr:acyl-CoA dehydrogenase family protein [Roseateles toxinivorans]TDP59575.1 citronellyl-CoA dehydrogenase [Roseateles toxinivorans]